ncbi:MAG: PaaI family thioesterase [Odoribacter sp.]
MTDYLQQLNEICRATLVEHLGMEFTAAGEGWLEAKMPIDHRTCRPDGALHGGANMALAETVGGALSSMSMSEEMRFKVFGIEVNGNHIKQAQGHYVIARGTFLHKGRRSHVVNVEIRDEFGTIVTVNRVTNMILIDHQS